MSELVLDNSEKFPSNVYRLEKTMHIFIAVVSSQHLYLRDYFVFFKVLFFSGGKMRRRKQVRNVA